jgi:DNA-binding NarL/FixJ family response regulator
MRILHVDDHRLFRDAIAEVLKALGSDVTVFGAGSADEARGAAGHYAPLDLILLDLFLPGSVGLDLLTELRYLAISAPIVVLSASEEREDIRAALEAGAAGYIAKTVSGPDMLAALRQVLRGEIFVPASLLAKMQSQADSRPSGGEAGRAIAAGLSSRQREVLGLLAEGLSNKAIARRLGLAEGTVKLHVSAILQGLGARNRTEAVTLAQRLGLVDHGG